MSTKLIALSQEGKKRNLAPKGGRLSDRYNIISPALFDEILKPNLGFFDAVDLREENLAYANTCDDKWADEKTFKAEVWQHDEHHEIFLFIRHQGRLYCQDSIMNVATVIQEIKAQEKRKIVW